MTGESIEPLLTISHRNQPVPVAHSILQMCRVSTCDSHRQTVRLRRVEHLDVEVAEEHPGQQRGDGHGKYRTNDSRAWNDAGLPGDLVRRHDMQPPVVID